MVLILGLKMLLMIVLAMLYGEALYFLTLMFLIPFTGFYVVYSSIATRKVFLGPAAWSIKQKMCVLHWAQQ